MKSLGSQQPQVQAQGKRVVRTQLVPTSARQCALDVVIQWPSALGERSRGLWCRGKRLAHSVPQRCTDPQLGNHFIMVIMIIMIIH